MQWAIWIILVFEVFYALPVVFHHCFLLQILASHTEGNTKIVDEVALIGAIQDPEVATQELLRAKEGIIVSHTANKELKIELRMLRGLRGVVRHEN